MSSALSYILRIHTFTSRVATFEARCVPHASASRLQWSRPDQLRSKAQVESAPMSDAGYSGTPLYRKPRISNRTRASATVAARAADFDRMLGPLPPARNDGRAKGWRRRRDSTTRFVTARGRTLEQGHRWKRSRRRAASPVARVAEEGIRHQDRRHRERAPRRRCSRRLVDRKVCAIDTRGPDCSSHGANERRHF